MPVQRPSILFNTRLVNARDRIFRPQHLSKAGKTPYRIIYHDGLVSVRHYHASSTTAEQPPLVLIAPLAVNMLIYDLFPERSLVRYLSELGRQVYLIDWGNPTRRYNHYSLATYALELLPQCLAAVRRHSGQRLLDLHGWSMGGHLLLCHAGRGIDADLGHLIIVGTSIDSHRSGAIGRFADRLNRSMNWLERNFSIQRQRLPAQWFYSPGWLNALNFKLTSPKASLEGYIELLRRLQDRDFVIDHATQAAFLDHMVAYPGALARDMFLEAWLANRFASGTMQLGTETIRFDRIRHPTLVIAGHHDSLATPAAVSALMPLLSSCERKTFIEVPGGHMGIVSGREAPTACWPRIHSWLTETPLS